MTFLRRLLGRKGKAKPAEEPPRGDVMEQSQAEQDEARKKMESDVADDRERRGATDVRPSDEDPPNDDPS